MTTIRFATFPRTEPPAEFVAEVVRAFRNHEPAISTIALNKGKTSDEVLAVLRDDLMAIGFQVEGGKRKDEKIERPVFFGENGVPTVRYEIDAYQPEWKCGLEVEAGRAWMGNAVYRDLIQASVMVEVNHLILAVSNQYKYRSGGKMIHGPDFDRTTNLADTLYGHSRLVLPYRLTVIGY